MRLIIAGGQKTSSAGVRKVGAAGSMTPFGQRWVETDLLRYTTVL